jgi:hypothetical protein
MIMLISEAMLDSRPFLRGCAEQALTAICEEPVFDPTLAKKVSVCSKGDPSVTDDQCPVMRCWPVPGH